MDFVHYPVFQRRGTMQANNLLHSNVPLLQRRPTMRPNLYYSDGGALSNISQQQSSQVIEIRSRDQWKSFFEASKENNKLLVIEFTATWCRPCRFMEAIIEEFATKYTDVQFLKIDVDLFMTVARQFNVGTTMPTTVLVKKGKEVDMVTGVKKSELQSKIEKHRIM